MKIIYQANDGAPFDSEAECRAYECRIHENLTKIRKAVSEKRVQMLTYDEKAIEEKDFLHCEDLEAFMDDVYYFRCNDKEVLEVLSDYFEEDFEQNIAYIYDDKNDMWKKIDDFINDYKSFINELLEIKTGLISGVTM